MKDFLPNMMRFTRSCLLIGMLLPWAAGATDATWVNNGTIVVAPNIDATNFVNNGTINISTTQPFDTSNTQNFTNSGSMSGSVGFRLDTAPRNSSGQLIGERRPAANFHNRNTGTITATEGFGILTVGGVFVSGGGGSYLLVQATNILNQGSLTVGANGLLQLVGTNVNVSRSALGVSSIAASPSQNGRTNFVPSTGITDNYWGQSNDTFNITQIATKTTSTFFSISNNVIVTNTLDVLNASSPPHDVFFSGFPQPATTFVSAQIVPFPAGYTNLVAAFTNALNPTNIFIQAVFVGLGSTNMGVDVRFRPSTIPTNGFSSVGIQISAVQTNVLASANETNYIYFSDTLAAQTNRGTLLNVVDGTRKPANYLISRFAVPEYTAGVTNNAVFTPELFADPLYDSTSSFGAYAGYSATIDNLVSRPPAVPGGDYTNYPGRIEIRAHQLDMNKARIRAEGLLSIQADHLINSSGAVVDSENLAFNIGSTNGSLVVQSLMKESVNRLRGTVSAWSAVWTNSVTPAGSSNVVNLNFHALILDAQVLQDTYPVSVYDLHAKATNVIVADNGILARTMLVDAESLTLNGNLTFSGTLENWEQSLVPTLKHFTNSGALSIQNEAHFGDEGNTPYRSFVNTGSIQSYGQTIRSDYAQLSGFQFASAAITLQATNGQIDGGTLFAGGAMTLRGDNFRLNQSAIDSGTFLELNVTNSLSDDGATSANTITVGDGFFMTIKPATGDLLGTTLISTAPNFALVNHVWAGRDDGVNISGYSNNVAVGVLSLSPDGFDPLFEFSGTGAANGLYVDLLDLSQLTDYTNQLQIDPNLTIYYAAVALNSSPTNGQSNEEYLDGQFGGRLRWVPGFAGPNSTTNVTINGNQVISVNLGLRNSSVLDSDADGIVNGLDASPFDGVTITSIKRNASPTGYLLTWNAAPATLYRVEARTNLTTAAWTTLFTTVSTNVVTGSYSVLDTNTAPAGVTRYYRVTYQP